MSGGAAGTARAFTVRHEGDVLVGSAPAWFGTHVFGGILLAQALHAASTTVADGARARSLHAYFLRAADARVPLRYEVAATKDGRTSSVRSVTATQEGAEVLTMQCSFAADREGREYDLVRAGGEPDVASLQLRSAPGPWESAFLGPTPEREDGTRCSTHRAWLRISDELPDNRALHDAAIAFIGDISWNAASPWDLSGPPDRTQMVSVDHAMWFHRAARADEWLYYDVHSLVHAGGRGTIRGVLFGPGRTIVASIVQELQFR